jgi:hypothetical protein
MTVEVDLALELIDALVDVKDDQQFHVGLCAMPVFLREPVRMALRKQMRGDMRRLAVLDRADVLAPRILAREVPYYIGSGPVEVIAGKAQRGEVSLRDALEMARVRTLVAQLVPTYVRVIAGYAVRLAHQKQWREAITFLRVLRSALDVAPESVERTQNLNRVEADWVEVALCALIEVPDRRLLEDAEQAGLRVVARTDPARGDDFAQVLMRLGVMYLDPFVKFRDLGNYAAAYERWHEAFPREYGASAAAVPAKAWRMPQLEEALPKAIDYLRRSADARTGAPRGRALKALAEALAASATLSGNEVSEPAVQAATEALKLLDPSEDADHIISLEDMLRRLGAPTHPATPLHSSGLRSERQVGLVLQNAMRLKESNPRAALEALRDARQLFHDHGFAQQRHIRLNEMAKLLRPAFAPRQDPGTWGNSWPEQLQGLRDRASTGAVSGRALAACLLDLAGRSIKANEEQRALPLIELALKADPTFASEYEEVARFQTLALYEGVGVNAFQARDYAQAATAYLAAFGVSLSLGDADVTLDMIERVNDVLHKLDGAKFPEGALELLGSNWLACERQLKERGAMELVKASAQLDRCVSNGSSEAFTTAWLLWQIAKGLRFSSGLAPSASPVPTEESTLLEEIRELERRVGQQDARADVDEELVLLSWLRPKASGQGLSDAVRLANLQHAFDARREDRLASAEERPVFLTPAEVVEQIGKDAALVALFLGEWSGHKLAVRSLSLTAGGGHIARMDYQADHSPVLSDRGGFELILSPLSEPVRTMRELVRGEPGFQPLSAEAAKWLAAWERDLTANMRAVLASQPQVKHVCFWPHGPLHFAPLHLLGPAGAPLGESVVVTYLPGLALLARGPAQGGSGILALGLEKSGRNLAPLVDAPEEAATIAALFGAKPLPEKLCTPQEVLKRLPGHRYVHIATHGAQNAIAPAFHHLVLAAGENGEDRLFAHDLDCLDLSMVELVTLSACDSALGRVDPSDNLRGLAASLFRAGVRTLVGTLWPTGSRVCRTFFVALYRELRSGASKRDAFARAQRETRTRHPQYRAWGAFYLMGDWR